MVHSTSLIPGISKFVDSAVLSQYQPTSMKRILGAGALSIYLKQNESSVNNMIDALGLRNDSNMINIELARDMLKNEISKVGFMRIHFPILGDVDFTADDVDKLYQDIVSMDNSSTPAIPATVTPSILT